MGSSSCKGILDYDEAVKRLSREEVDKIEEGFSRLSVGGELRRSEFRNGFLNSAAGDPVPEALAEALFQSFDSDASGSLSVRQFVCGVAVLRNGNPEEKLRLLFNVYDADRDQRLSDRDLVRFAHALSDGRGETQESAVDGALKALAAAGPSVNFEKFAAWAYEHIDSPLVDWVFDLRQRLTPVTLEEPETPDSAMLQGRAGHIGAWRMKPPIERTVSTQDREDHAALMTWSREVGLEAELTTELRAAWQSLVALSQFGVVDKAVFTKAFPSLPAELLGRLFQALDESGSGTVAEREWIQGLYTCLLGSTTERQDFVFRMFASYGPEGSAPAIQLARAAELMRTAQAAQSVFTVQTPAKPSRPLPEPLSRAGLTAEPWASDADVVAKALGYVARIDLQMAPRDPREEWEIVDRVGAKFSPAEPGQAGDTWYLICGRWWKQWLHYTGERAAQSERSHEQGPPSIDNTMLVDHAHRFLRFGLCEGEDYEVITEGAWRALLSWYNGPGPALPRKVIEIDGRLELEMYPLRLHVSRSDKAGNVLLLERQLEISRAALLADAKKAACELHDISDQGEEMVLFHRSSSNLEWMPGDEGKTLHALQFLDNHQLLLRMKGTQPPNLNSVPSGWSSPSGLRKGGLVGLQNLGNTCYMNAAVQCLVHTPFLPGYFLQEYQFDVNSEGSWGMGGKLAVAWAELLQDIDKARLEGSGVVAPREFKRIFSDFKPQFAGWKQQDSQEFLSMFLAGLSDDVNRTVKKPYIELKDSDGRPDEEVAQEYWHAHCIRERSAVAALFSGQFRSSLRCSVCGLVNISFDPFSFLPIPIPEHDYRWVTCMVVRAAGCEPGQQVVQVCARVAKRGCIEDLLHAAGGMLGLEAEDLVAAEVANNYVFRLLSAEQVLSSLSDDARPWIFHARLPEMPVLPPPVTPSPSRSPSASAFTAFTGSLSLTGTSTATSSSSGRFRENSKANPGKQLCPSEPREVVVYLVHRRLRKVTRYFLNPYKSELFGTPIVLRLPSRCLNSQIYSTAWQMVRHLVPDLEQPSEGQWPFTLSTVKRDGTACVKCSWRQGCHGCTLPWADEADCTSLLEEETLSIDWDATVLQRQYKDKIAAHVHVHQSVQLSQMERKTSVSLDQCLGSLVQDESVTAYCRECTKQAKGEFTESQHVKSFSVWGCPPLLVLQLKRFQVENGSSYKLFNEVTFTRNLDLKDFLAKGPKAATCKRSAESLRGWDKPLRERSKSDDLEDWAGFDSLSREVTGYKLYGVVNHIGGMGSGHYTASIRSQGQWFCFNDDRVYSISEEDVCSPNAYLLFYARNDLATKQVSFEHLFPQTSRKDEAVDIEAVKKKVWASADRSTDEPKSPSITTSAVNRYCAMM
eukprot:TRINITY_DN37048_c0_g1_i1.p1 TRINITY_DN37048_c0_g1~~TRINITY_DN37048_c0_g1_i1.p1  ORF type:complete len:1368 (+),score=256.41 TRINITY_DN37048_c0_g1_i1:41-4144(+)